MTHHSVDLLAVIGNDVILLYCNNFSYHDGRAKAASLELGKREVLLVQVPGVISNSSFFPCSQLRSLAATNLGSKKQKLEEKSPSTNFVKGENQNFLTV